MSGASIRSEGGHKSSDGNPGNDFDNWDDSTFDPSLNCHGVVHVKLLEAQRLPCPVGSSVVGVSSLPPFVGQVKTARVHAFLSPDDESVCVCWDASKNVGMCSMVNAWNSKDSPCPSIKIDIRFSPIGLGLLDFTMCTIQLSCAPLISEPRVWKSRWFDAFLSESPSHTAGKTSSVTPRIRIEATFVPDDTFFSPGDAPSKTSSLSTAHSEQRDDTIKLHELRGDVLLAEEKAESSSVDFDGHLSEEVPNKSSKPHFLRLDSFWMPGSCAVCSKVLVGKHAGFICERCGIRCCADCRLNVDLKVLCGHNASLQENPGDKKFSVDRILSIVAPDAHYAEKRRSNRKALVSGNSVSLTEKTDHGVGSLSVDIQKAHICAREWPPEERQDVVLSASSNVREGEYYVRITSQLKAEKTWRTHRVFAAGSSSFNFRDGATTFVVDYYGEDFKLECIDAGTDEVIGAVLLSTQGILQDQRESFAAKSGPRIFQIFRGPIVEENVHSTTLLLRKYTKDGLFVEQSDAANDVIREEGTASEAGAISGWIQLNVGMLEFVEKLFDINDPTQISAPPSQELQLAAFQTHISRVKAIIEDMKALSLWYTEVVSWKDPLVSLTCFLFSTFMCFRLNIEYIGSIPFAIATVLMFRSTIGRGRSGRRDIFVRQEARLISQDKHVVNYRLNRPFGIVSIAIPHGRNLLSRDLGVPGMTFCKIVFEPYWFLSEDEQQTAEVGGQRDYTYEVGTTAAILSADPDWDKSHYCSSENKRLMQILRQDDIFFSNGPNTPVPSLSIPVLQPFEIHSNRRDSTGRLVDCSLRDWGSSVAAIVVQVQLGLGFAENIGEVVISVSQIVESQEIKGWFPVTERRSKSFSMPSREVDGSSDVPRLFLHIRWSKSTENDAAQTEVSDALQEELAKSSQGTGNRRFELLGNSIGAMNTALGLGNHALLVQNTLGTVLDSIERAQNLINFTDPFKSSLAMAILCLCWYTFTVIKTRFIIFLAIVLQFVPNLFSKYRKQAAKYIHHAQQKQKTLSQDEKTRRDVSSRAQTWLHNFFNGLPTKEDFRKAYYWDIRRFREDEIRRTNTEKRASKLRSLWKAKWHSEVDIYSSLNKSESPGSSLERGFALIEGRRFIWWSDVAAFDKGGLASGAISLSGHSGIASPSPAELKGIPAKVRNLSITIFGRSSSGQKRLTVTLPDVKATETLQTTVSSLSEKSD